MVSAIDLAMTPSAPPPPGVMPNLIDPPNMYPYTIATAAATLGLTVPSVLIRLFTKSKIQKELNWEDYILVVAEASLINWEILYLVQPTRGADVWNTSLADTSKLLYWSNLLIVLYCPGILLAKWTIVLQIQRIFIVQPGQISWWLARAIVWISTLFYVTVCFCDIFQCNPRQKIWMPQTPGTCLDINKILIGTCFFNIVMNAAIVSIPLLVVKDLQMKLKRKFIASVVFGLAALALVAACLRLAYTYKFVHSANPTRDILPVGYWAGAEMALVIFATAFPTFSRFYLWCRGRDPATVAATTVPAGGTVALERSRTMRTWPNTNRRSQWDEFEMVESPTAEEKRGSMYSVVSDRRDRRASQMEAMGGITKTVEFEVSHSSATRSAASASTSTIC